MKLIVAGVGPGAAGLVTRSALDAASSADLVLAPCARDGAQSVAGDVLRTNIPDLDIVPFVFPMTGDAERRDAVILENLTAIRSRWENAEKILLPVIGDSALYATGAYLFDVWRTLVPDLELELIPGVSAHSLAASCARRFLAMGTDILCIIPGTADKERIAAALASCDAAAVYKPSALGGELAGIVNGSGPWEEIIRVDRAGLPDERILHGGEAVAPASEYLSVLLLRRRVQ